MQTFDWLVVGNGIAGAALSYELARQGLSVLLLEKSPDPENATRFSYGGIPYWSGSTELLRQLNREGLARHQVLSDETGIHTEFRELDLLLTVAPEENVQTLASRYAAVETPPVPISAQEAAAREPQLNPAAMAGALRVRHGHVNPTALVKAYNHGLQAAGGHIVIAPVMQLVRMGDRITGVTTPTQAYAAGNVAIAAGSHTRELLKTAGVKVPVYFTYAEIIETQPLTDIALQTLIMPADLTRTALESTTSDAEMASRWDQGNQEIVPPILDTGLVQFKDGTVRLGQISRIHTSDTPAIDVSASERWLRQGVADLAPSLAQVTGQWQGCQVAFSTDGLPVVGPVPGLTGAAVFSGFGGPFALVPGTATRFAHWAAGKTPIDTIQPLSPGRFLSGC